MSIPPRIQNSTKDSQYSISCKTRQTSLLQFLDSNNKIMTERRISYQSFQSSESMEVDERSFSIDEDSQDSGISCDSFSNNESLFVSTAATNFSCLMNKPSPDIPDNYANQLDEVEIAADNFLKSWSRGNKELKTPLKDVTNIRRNETQPSSPVSRKPSSRRLDRKRSTFRIFDQECKRLKRIADENAVVHFNKFHRTFSTSQLESSYHYDSSPECSYSLSVVKTRESKDFAFRRIESSVLMELLASPEEFHKKYLLIDCRYPYEYNGGHIKDAINVYDPDELLKIFYPEDQRAFVEINSKIPIFYCEFSSVRGPNMANALRKFDRNRNFENWPKIDYPQIYVLKNGYQGFYHEIQSGRDQFCHPPKYVKMTSSEFSKELQKYPYHKKTSSSGLGLRTRSMKPLTSRSATTSPCPCRSTQCDCERHTVFQRTLGDEFSNKCMLNSPAKIGPRSLSLDDSPPINLFS